MLSEDLSLLQSHYSKDQLSTIHSGQKPVLKVGST